MESESACAGGAGPHQRLVQASLAPTGRTTLRCAMRERAALRAGGWKRRPSLHRPGELGLRAAPKQRVKVPLAKRSSTRTFEGVSWLDYPTLPIGFQTGHPDRRVLVEVPFCEIFRSLEKHHHHPPRLTERPQVDVVARDGRSGPSLVAVAPR